MLPDIDFRRIRSWRGSQDNAFEELCCQLASLEDQPEGSRFVRKEGSGGDAGVEGYWVLPDGSELGWQTKFFIDEFGSTQWRQIDKSVKAALKGHPELRQYWIVLPRDLTDQRQKNKKSQREKWDKSVENWRRWAADEGMEVEFSLWGASELTERLTRKDPLYSGRILFWFGDTVLSLDWMREKHAEAVANLGER